MPTGGACPFASCSAKVNYTPGQVHYLDSLSHLSLHFLENLHAKCYFNEQSMVIASMNLYEYSEKNNREMGLLLERGADRAAFEDALQEAKSITDAAKLIYEPKSVYATHRLEGRYAHSSVHHPPRNARILEVGHCIRCGETIQLNPGAPLCGGCYAVWAEYGNYEYSENFCHVCGQQKDTSRRKPVCRTCYHG